ncbi:hypothetical protein BGZ94_001809 [Podila epigama]|nr:hypothetical protein BGZ94_001809 [Podila epigama]
MPVTLEDPFQLASFSSTIHHNDQHQTVSCAPEKDTSSTDDESEDKTLLVVAVQGEGVQLFNAEDQKCVLSYSAPPGYSFNGSAQTLNTPTHRNIYAVVAKGADIPAKEEGKTVWMWRDESLAAKNGDNDVEMSEAVTEKPSTSRKNVHKFDRTIHQLFVSPLLPNHVILVNTDSSLSLVTEDLKRVVNTKDYPTKTKKDKNSKPVSAKLIWTRTFNTTGSWISANALARDTLIILTVTRTAYDISEITFSYVDAERRGFSHFGHVAIQSGPDVSGFAFDPKSGQLSFMTADGHLKIYKFEVSPGDHTVTFADILTLPLPGYILSTVPSSKPSKKGAKSTSQNDTRTQRTDSIALGENYLAIAGMHKDGAKAELTLTVWDAKYGTLQAKHVVAGSFSEQDTTCYLTLLPDSVLVLTISSLVGTSIKSDIYLCRYYAEAMSLLGAMGRMKDTAPFIGLKGHALSQDAFSATTTTPLLTPSHLGGSVKAEVLAKKNDVSRTIDMAHSIENKALKKLQSEESTPTVAKFEKVFFDNVDRLSQEAIEEAIGGHPNADSSAQSATDATTAKKGKEQQSEAMDMDVEPTKETGKEDSSNKKTKAEKKKAAKAAAKASAKEAAEGSSSESSSDDDDDDDDAIVLSSDDEDVDAEEDRRLDEDLKQREEDERARLEAHVAKLAEWREAKAEAVKNAKIKARERRMASKAASARPELSHHFLVTVLERCFRRLSNGQPDMSFWPEMVVRYLLLNQHIGNSNPGAGKAGVVLELMERDQWSLIELALQKLHDIPDNDIIMMLKQVIALNKNKTATTSESNPASTSSSSASSTTTTTSASTSSASSSSLSASSTTTTTATKKASASSTSVPEIQHFLRMIMAAPRNEIFMQHALKRLGVEEISIVLEILGNWLSIWSEEGGIGCRAKGAASKLPDYGVIVDFTSLLMDVHFPSLILSPHLHPVMKSIQESIQKEATICSQMEESLRGCLSLFDRKHQDYLRRKSGKAIEPAMVEKKRKGEGDTVASDYVVEVIHL